MTSLSDSWIIVPPLNDVTNSTSKRSRSRSQSRSRSEKTRRSPSLASTKSASTCALSGVPFPTTLPNDDIHVRAVPFPMSSPTAASAPRTPPRSLRRQRSSARLNVNFLYPATPTSPAAPLTQPPTNKRLRLHSSSLPNLTAPPQSPKTKRKKPNRRSKSVGASLRFLAVVYRSIVSARELRAGTDGDEESEFDKSERDVLVRLRDYLVGMGMDVDNEVDGVAARPTVGEHPMAVDAEIEKMSTLDMDMMFDMEVLSSSSSAVDADTIVPVPVLYAFPPSSASPPPVTPSTKRKKHHAEILPLPSLVATLILRHRDRTREKPSFVSRTERSESPLGRFVVGGDGEEE